MSWIEDRLQRRQKELEAIYEPRAAFGNNEIIALVSAIDDDVAYLETHKKCGKCEGSGEVDHECDCELCPLKDEECKECHGEGYVEKS